MPKKNTFDFKKWLIIGAIPPTLVAMVFLANIIVTAVNVPKRVDAVEYEQKSTKELLNQQQIMNQRIAAQLGWDEPVKSPDGKFWWDKDEEKWRPVKELQNGR